jgi:hypothetical protein
VVIEQAAWHTTEKPRIPDSLLLLPPKSPEPNPVENVRQFLRQNKLSNRIFGDYHAIVPRLVMLGTAASPSGTHHLNRNPDVGNHKSDLTRVGISGSQRRGTGPE